MAKIEENKFFMKMGGLRELSVSACKSAWRMGRENPRKFIHAVKVGMAFTVVSLLYLLDPLFNGIGENAIWAIMTVVMMLEFTAGSTLYRGLNRGVGTIFGGLLAYVVQEMTASTGGAFRAVFIGASVFVVGFVATYLRFFPCVKDNYDYGMGVILVTFNLIIASSYRMPSALGFARLRLYTIGIGFSVCLVMSLIILPNWSGKDLHKSTVKKLETLSKSVEGVQVERTSYGWYS
ncbi:aluminum-activated malate transporter 12-like [Asparagus officinalis]|uniref:aluminum-activated malate transporter 12-like n=1 Tax=Asparagus officinalis TaxID=4686 RepID=UPI00098E516E|nr:aluminum-activated malate transporter 12-like [Asparagus officinalis]